MSTKTDRATGRRGAATPAPAVPRLVHDPAAVVQSLLDKIGQPRRHLTMLVGAGASRVAGIPGITGLAKSVAEHLEAEDRTEFDRLSATRGLEDLLSYLRLTRSLLADQDAIFDGLSATAADRLDRAITRAIATIVHDAPQASDPHDRLAVWLGRSLRPAAVEVFTTNYDLLLERAFERRGVPYFDGFVGVFGGQFRADLIEPDEAPDEARLPAGWVRLWKLHGSVSWIVDRATRQIARTGDVAHADPETVLAVYPSAEKYEESRRMPFLALIDRFRRALATPETTTVTIGYSFGDAHINELVFNAVERHQRSEVIALFHAAIPDAVADRALRYRNFTVYGATEAILSGERGPYGEAAASPGWDGEKLTVGDFSTLAALLARAEAADEAEGPE